MSWKAKDISQWDIFQGCVGKRLVKVEHINGTPSDFLHFTFEGGILVRVAARFEIQNEHVNIALTMASISVGGG